MKFKTIALTIVAALTLAAGGGAAGAAVIATSATNTGKTYASAWMSDAIPGDKVIVSGCVIRFLVKDGGRPSIHANGAHRCAGVEKVSIDGSGQIRVDQSVEGASVNVVLFAVCQADETLGGSRGIICGASGGTDYTRYRLYDPRTGRALNLNKAADRQRVMGDTANLWIGAFHLDGSKR